MITDSPTLDSDDGLPKLLVDELALSQTDSDSDSDSHDIQSHHNSVLNVSIDDFTCSICLDLMIEPISLPCGHSHCRTCLVECAQKGSKRCPSCRASINSSMNLLDAPQCVLLARIIQSAFPSVYEKRQTINQSIKQTWKSRFPVCFVDTVLFPYQSMLVHLTEPRYELMCQRLINQSNNQTNKRFALFSNRCQSSLVDSVGLVVEASEIKQSNGAYLVYVTAVERCSVTECWEEPETGALFQAQIELCQDDIQINQNNTTQIHDIHAKINESISIINNLGKPTCSFSNEFGSTPIDPCELSFWLFSCLLNNRSARGDLSDGDYLLVPKVLASKSVLWRLERGLDMLNEAIQQLRARFQQPSNHVDSIGRSRLLQSSAPVFVPTAESNVGSSRMSLPRGSSQRHPSGRHVSRDFIRYSPRNTRPVWSYVSAEQHLRHNQTHRGNRSLDQ